MSIKNSIENDEFIIAAYKSIVPYQRNVKVVFSDFDITFLGINDVTTDGGAKISLQTTDFKVTNKHDSSEQILNIGNGQLPNRPRAFSVGKKTFTLYTYADPDNKRLPDQTLFITTE